MKLHLLSHSDISGNNLSMSQTILFHYICSRNTNEFSERMSKHFCSNVIGKEDALMNLIKEIEDFKNGVTFFKSTKRKVGSMIKPFNYTLKPFLKENKRGAEHLIIDIDQQDKNMLTELTNSLWFLISKVY